MGPCHSSPCTETHSSFVKSIILFLRQSGKAGLRSSHLSLDERDGSDGLLQTPDLRRGAGDQRRPGVHDGLAAAFAQSQLAAHCQPVTHRHTCTCFSIQSTVTASLCCHGVIVELSPVHVDLPVGLAGDVDVVEVTGVVFGVGSSEEQLASRLSVRVPDKEERENTDDSGSTLKKFLKRLFGV